MAVTEVKLLSVGASGGVEGSDSDSAKVSYSLTYQAKCDSGLDSPLTVMNYFRQNANYPWLGRIYRFGNDLDTSAVCRSVKPQYIENSEGIFIVPCEFADVRADDEKPEKGTTAKKEKSDNPLEWHDELSVGFGTYSAPVEMATFVGALNASTLSPFLKPGKFLPITNSKLEPLDPSFEEEFSIKIIRITKNVLEYDDDFLNQYHDTINDNEVTIDKPDYLFKATIAKHYGRLRVGYDYATVNGYGYYKRTIEYHIKGWDRAILDQSHVYSEILREGDTGRDGRVISASDLPRGRLSIEVPVHNNDGLSQPKPMLLDGNGKELKEGNPPVSLGWQALEEKDHSSIDW